MENLEAMLLLTPEEVAQTQIACASRRGLPEGAHYRRGRVATPSQASRDEEVAKRLWFETVAWLAAPSDGLASLRASAK